VGRGLVDGQAHLFKAGHLQNVFAQVVVQVVECEVGHNLLKFVVKNLFNLEVFYNSPV
jgi:hypothetical protein